MKNFNIKFKPKTIARNELHFQVQKTTRGVIFKDKTKYDRKALKREKLDY